MTEALSQKVEGLSGVDTELAKETLKLLDKYQKLQDRYNTLFKLNQLSNDCDNIDTFYHQVHQAIASLMNAENFYIVLYDQTLATIQFVYHVDEKDAFLQGPIPLKDFEGSMTNYVIETAKPLLATPELVKELASRHKIKHLGVQGTDWLGVPLIFDGFVIGVMVIQSYSESTRYQLQDLELLVYTAQHVVTTMTRLQDHERLQKAVNARTKELMQQIRVREKSELLQESLFRISELTNDATIDINKFYAMVHHIVGQLINAESFYIARYSNESDILKFVYYVDQNSKNPVEDYQPRKLSNRYTEVVIRQGKTILLTRDEMLDLYEKGIISTKPEKEITSWLGVPLIHAGDVVGAMVIQSYQRRIVYTEQDAELLNFVSQHVSTAIKRRELADFERKTHDLLEQQVKLRTAALEAEIKQRKLAEQQLTHAASHDGLTGLANRVIFIDLLNHAIACGVRDPDNLFAVLFLDLDRFKVVNDSLGHHAGDILLKIVAKELKALVREKDTVARFGGDEFVILIEDLDAKQEAFDIAKRITEFLATPFTIENQPVFIGTSIGVLFNDKRYENADFMLRDADIAMYHAKDKGRGRYEVFDASMHNKIQDTLALEVDIRDAIVKHEFIAYYQPIVRLSDDHIVGFEALARWQSPKRGLVFPDDFIPLAEETNLVMAIDFQIIEQSCQQLKIWQAELQRDDLYISCNLFSDHFFSLTLAEDLAAIITKVGVLPRQLRIELTERALLEKSDIVLKNMQALKQLGVKILLDDFGTGYSSLSYLHRFPIDVLKIDRSFINNVHEHDNHQAIIKTIIDLAINLQMTTVGEGIENLADAQLLKKMDCSYGQGYYFAKPMPAEDVNQYLLACKVVTLSG
ncbi:MAG: diguanylate cyclase (GGDEF)-like protein [Alteromonadaceae bacterium]|jgi:diguanylate cyclase (GGDEF)-like protein